MVRNYLTLAPGQTKLIQTHRTDTWVGRNGRRRCLSMFVSEHEFEKWEIVADEGSEYGRRDVRSFPVYVAPEFDDDPALLERCLTVLEANATQLEQVIPAPAWQRISGTPIWLEYKSVGGYAGRYSTSAEWLADHGMAVAKAKSIEFTSYLAATIGSQVNLLSHELAHAYHDLVLSLAYPQIGLAFDRARTGGRYNAVRDASGRWKRAYAMENHGEFFAELSEAYLGTNDFFPFTRDDLKAFDPDSYRVISEAWERPPESSQQPRRRAAWPLSAPKGPGQ